MSSNLDLERSFDWDGASVRGTCIGTGPGSTLELISGAGHLIQEDTPAELSLAIRRWLYPGQMPSRTAES